jgi:hypothetical protein
MRKARHEHMWSGLAQRSDLTADMLNWPQRAITGNQQISIKASQGGMNATA